MNRTPLATGSASKAVGGPAGRCHLRTRTGGRAVMGSPHSADLGAPAWVDLGSPAGTTTAARFYCGLFGWSVVARHRPLEDPVGYWIFQQGGKDVGGLAPAEEATWTVYVTVTDVDAMARAVTGNGGAVLVGPMTVDAGRMVVCADPLGASFVMWQPDRDAEVDVEDEAGSFTSYQLACRDADAAKTFYGAVFGWEAKTTVLAEGCTYTEFFHPGTERTVARMVEMNERWPTDVPASWMVHLEVSDTDRTAARAAELGGMVSVAPFDLPNIGRLAVLNDPERAVFSVLQAA
jgi:predicted enzyme related to lactoylglutathione lyase